MSGKGRIPFLFAAAGAAMMLFPGCAALRSGNGPEKPAAAAEAAAVRPGVRLLESFIADDAKAFTGELPPEMRRAFGPEKFAASRNAMLRELGEPVSFRHLAVLEHPLLRIDLYAVRFKRKKKSEPGVFVKQETLFRTVSGRLNGKETVLSFQFL